MRALTWHLSSRDNIYRDLADVHRTLSPLFGIFYLQLAAALGFFRYFPLNH
jgi:hypothetical protein